VQALADAWAALGSYSACMFVSGNAVEHFFRPKHAAALEGSAGAAIKNIANESVGCVGFVGFVGSAGEGALCPRFLATGPGTAAALLAAGVPGGQIDAPPPDAPQFDSEALWQVVGQRGWLGKRVLVVRGFTGEADSQAASSGRDWITRQWQAAGASVDTLGVYVRRAPVLDAAQWQRLRSASHDGTVWVFSSSEAVANLAALAAALPPDSVQWHRARAVATHPRIAASVRALGWGTVTESRPALPDVLQALATMAAS
jgi:uroporphyrinogen-III synthase